MYEDHAREATTTSTSTTTTPAATAGERHDKK